MLSLNSRENRRLVLYLQVSCFYLIDLHVPPFPKAFADMLSSESNKHNLTLWRMWHVTFLQPVCLLFVLITLAIHSPHHLPILLTVMYSLPPVTNPTDASFTSTGLQQDSRGDADLNNILYWKWLCFVSVFSCVCPSQMCRGIFPSIWPLRPAFFWPGSFQRAATPTALLYVHQLLPAHDMFA